MSRIFTDRIVMPLTATGNRKQKLTTDAAVASVMIDGKWRSPYELQQIVNERFGRWHSDSGITASLRRLRQKGYTVTCRRRAGTNYNVYRVGE